MRDQLCSTKWSTYGIFEASSSFLVWGKVEINAINKTNYGNAPKGFTTFQISYWDINSNKMNT